MVDYEIMKCDLYWCKQIRVHYNKSKNEKNEISNQKGLKIEYSLNIIVCIDFRLGFSLVLLWPCWHLS